MRLGLRPLTLHPVVTFSFDHLSAFRSLDVFCFYSIFFVFFIEVKTNMFFLCFCSKIYVLATVLVTAGQRSLVSMRKNISDT